MKKTILFTVALAALIIISCSKSEDDPAPITGTNPVSTTGNVMMHFHSSWGMDDFHLDSIYSLASTISGVPARQIKFTTANMYVSGFSFDSTVNNTYLLISPASMMYSIGTMSPGTFTNLSFNVGIDSLTNHADPTTAQAPLNEMGMHWNWNTSAGYKFVKLEGQVDTSSTGMAGEWKGFAYHVATDPMLRNVSYAHNNTVTAGLTTTANYHVMWNNFFNGIDIATNPSNHGGGVTNAAIVNNAQSVFMVMP